MNTVLKTFEYPNLRCFLQSLAPSSRYQSMHLLAFVSALYAGIDKVFGLDGAAFIGLALVFVAELTTGITASMLQKEKFSSARLSRFTLKAACYLVLIASTWLMSISLQKHDKQLPAWVMDWLHIFLLMQIFLENVVSVLENLACINGKPKPAYIDKIREKFEKLIG